MFSYILTAKKYTIFVQRNLIFGSQCVLSSKLIMTKTGSSFIMCFWKNVSWLITTNLLWKAAFDDKQLQTQFQTQLHIQSQTQSQKQLQTQSQTQTQKDTNNFSFLIDAIIYCMF